MSENFLILTALKKMLSEYLTFSSVYLTVPPEAKFPYCAISLQESLRNEIEKTSILKFSVECKSEALGENENLCQSQDVLKKLNGLRLPIQEGGSVKIRHVGSVKESNSTASPLSRKVIVHYFEALSRGF